MPPSEHLSADDARRIALAAQGFSTPRPRRVGVRELRRALETIGVLQLDYVNVLVPAHYLIPYSRIGPYDRSLLDDLVYCRREFTEMPAHEASVVPVAHWPLLRHRLALHDRRARALAKFLERHGEYAAEVLGAVGARGPLHAGELAAPVNAPTRTREGWSWSMQKAALEAHFYHGALAVTERRSDLARVYDLPARVLPAVHGARPIPPEEAERMLVTLAVRALGVGTGEDVADYYRMPARVVKRRLTELHDAGAVMLAKIEGWRGDAYVDATVKRVPSVRACALLSPFDPVVWFRPRAARLFAFDYRIEIYTPAARRRWGYYVLPFLLGDRLVARVDVRLARKHERLEVAAAYAEAGVDNDEVARALAAELKTLGDWLGARTVRVARKGGLARALGAAVRG